MAELADRASLQREVDAVSWYHSIELGQGLVTDGWFDLRPHVGRYGLPERLDGLRALDVGTWDGFWAFELERRGAEVVALDIDHERDLDWPPRRRPASLGELGRERGFELAHRALGSGVERVVGSIYEASPERLGSFDIVICGMVLIHLRDQLLALERIAALCSGTFIAAEEYDRVTSWLPYAAARFRGDRDRDVVFWQPSARAWKRMLWTAGFDRVVERARFTVTAGRRTGKPFRLRHLVLHADRSAAAPAPTRRPPAPPAR